MSDTDSVLREARHKTEEVLQRLKKHPLYGASGAAKSSIILGGPSYDMIVSDLYDIARQLDESTRHFPVEDHDRVRAAINEIRNLAQ